jgi:sugar O-acyltransferase (sialic acid O-acetyltransferase NeuD family)
VLDRTKLVDIEKFTASNQQFYACAFFPATRRAHFAQAVALGLQPAEALVDPHAVIARSVRIGNATFINAGAIIGAVTMIGDCVLINRGATIGHHCAIGDFASIGPGATLASNIRVGDGSIIGAGATVLPDVRIGENCVIAGGSLVSKDVADGAFVVGVPAKPRPFDPLASALFIEDGE